MPKEDAANNTFGLGTRSENSGSPRAQTHRNWLGARAPLHSLHRKTCLPIVSATMACSSICGPVLRSARSQRVVGTLLIVQLMVSFVSVLHNMNDFGAIWTALADLAPIDVYEHLVEVFSNVEDDDDDGNDDGDDVLRYSLTLDKAWTNESETFSACLLIMDDNHRLSEWIAYHYYALPLRYLVVAVDPHSRTSPSQILHRWRDRITILEWTDTDFTNQTLLIDENDTVNERTSKHRLRQSAFYRACAMYLKNQNRTWTTFHDVDEFIAVNGDVVENKESLIRQPGHILPVIQHFRSNVTQRQGPMTWYKHFRSTHCITIPRTLYSAVESADQQVQRDVPAWLDGRQFDTLRWRFRATKRLKSEGPAKSIVDVSQVVEDELARRLAIHRLLKNRCTSIWVGYNLPIGIQHYLGSWESYSFRDDARKSGKKSYEDWKEQAEMQNGGADDDIRPWLQRFVDYVGKTAAEDLLLDAGLPLGYNSSANLTSDWLRRRRNVTIGLDAPTKKRRRGKKKQTRRGKKQSMLNESLV